MKTRGRLRGIIGLFEEISRGSTTQRHVFGTTIVWALTVDVGDVTDWLIDGLKIWRLYQIIW